MRAPLVAVLLTASLAAGCRTPCSADEELTPETRRREQTAMYRGQGICLELAHPKLDVGAQGGDVVLTTVTPVRLGAVADLTGPDDYPPLTRKLISYREHFRAVRAEAFAPTLHLAVPGSLDAAKLRPLLRSALASSYRHVSLTTNGVTTTFDVTPECELPKEGRVAEVAPRLCK